jgi:hypothetical protein
MDAGSRDDVHEGGEPIRCVDLDLHDRAVEADHGARVHFGEHAAKCKQDGGEGQVGE